MAAKIGIGIDTGGTYTDAVVYDFNGGKVLAKAKALTTKNDLSVGILEAIGSLPKDLLRSAFLVSLSTTLATNACVENKGGRAKLIFFGGDEKILSDYGGEYGLGKRDEIYIQPSFTKFSGESYKEVDWNEFKQNTQNEFNNLDGVGIIELNALKNGAVIEKAAKEIFAAEHDIPVICGHELFNELNSLQRGASTLLNASLFPLIKEFLTAIKTALKKMEVNASVVIMRSDGSIMSEEFANYRPVETLLCGPAASVVGAAYLNADKQSGNKTESAHQESGGNKTENAYQESGDNKTENAYQQNSGNNIVIDMGGTTTDIALIKKGVPVLAGDGVHIGKWKTFVKGLYIHTFGLGGDSAVHYDYKNVILEEYRVIPLCVSAEKYPIIKQRLKNITDLEQKHTKYLHEFYIAGKAIDEKDVQSGKYSCIELEFYKKLCENPLSLQEAAAFTGKDVYNFDVSRLVKEGVVAVSGLTPTDIMHIKKDFNRYDAEASYLGAKFIASNLEISVDEVCEKVYSQVKRKLYCNVVSMLLKQNYTEINEQGITKQLDKFINLSYVQAVKRLAQSAENGQNAAGKLAQSTGNGQNPTLLPDGFISHIFKTDFTLIGIGAPIKIFLSDVAKMLSTDALIPQNFEVANALGAIVGQVFTESKVEIRPIYVTDGIEGYKVNSQNESLVFKEREEAEVYADSLAESLARAEAKSRGAYGEIKVEKEVVRHDGHSKDGTVYMGSEVIARAVGSPRI